LKFKVVKQTSIHSTNVQNKESNEDRYVLVNKHFFQEGDKLNFKLYSPDDKTHMSLFLQADSVIIEEQREKLKHLEQLFVLKSEKDKYKNFLENNLQKVLKNDTLTLDEKTEIVYETSTDLTQDLYTNPNALENAKLSKTIVEPILETIFYHKDTISSYLKIIEYDYYTHTHSLNVSVYALCLGHELQLDKEVLTALGRSALLHDIGKSKISSNIVNKSGALSNFEFEVMKKHPRYGYELALSYNIKDQNILDGILFHHEKLDGHGYPNQIDTRNIGLFPRIISICDVFDALTTQRSYKNSMRSYEALMLMKTIMNAHFDMSILNTFIKMLHK